MPRSIIRSTFFIFEHNTQQQSYADNSASLSEAFVQNNLLVTLCEFCGLIRLDDTV